MAEIHFNRGAVNPAQCISDGWQVIKGEYGLFLGISFVTYLLIGCVPIAQWFLIGPAMGGVFYCLLQRMRGANVAFGDMFKGFDKFVPLMIVGLFQSVPTIILQILQLTANLASSLINVRSGRTSGSSFFVQSSSGAGVLTGGIIIIFLIIFVVFFIGAIAWGVSFFFAYPLVVEHNLSVGDAIRTSAKAGWSNFGGIFLLFLLEGLLMFAGALALCIGMFFVMPVIHAANAVAYRQAFPSGQEFAPNAPPPPTDFGSDYGRPTNYGGV